jgi:hypothetical protein
MSDWQTVRKQILEELNKPNDSSYADRAMAEAIRHHRTEHYWFNESRFEIVTSANVWHYPLPSDFLRPIGEIYYARVNSATSRRKMSNKTNDFVEQTRYLGTDPDRWGSWESGISSGPPSVYAIYNGELCVSPIPDTDAEVIDGRYVRDLGTPQVIYNGSAWAIYTPWSLSTALPATYANNWLTDGQDLIRSRAIYYMQKRLYRNDEGAQNALMDNVEAMNRLRTESHRRRGPKSIRGSF